MFKFNCFCLKSGFKNRVEIDVNLVNEKVLDEPKFKVDSEDLRKSGWSSKAIL